MTNTKLLRDIIAESGIKYKSLAKSVGITPYGLQKKIDNDNQFKAGEILTLSDELGLTTRQRDGIFFARQVE